MRQTRRTGGLHTQQIGRSTRRACLHPGVLRYPNASSLILQNMKRFFASKGVAVPGLRRLFEMIVRPDLASPTSSFLHLSNHTSPPGLASRAPAIPSSGSIALAPAASCSSDATRPGATNACGGVGNVVEGEGREEGSDAGEAGRLCAQDTRTGELEGGSAVVKAGSSWEWRCDQMVDSGEKQAEGDVETDADEAVFMSSYFPQSLSEMYDVERQAQRLARWAGWNAK